MKPNEKTKDQEILNLNGKTSSQTEEINDLNLMIKTSRKRKISSNSVEINCPKRGKNDFENKKDQTLYNKEYYALNKPKILE